MKLMALPRHIFSSAVAWSFLVTALRAGGALFVLPMILRSLPSEQLGMWYVFGSLGSFAALLDAGIAPMTTRVAGYLWAGATRIQAFGLHSKGEVTVDGQPNYPGLRDLAATLRRYYKFLGVLVFLIMFFAGGSWVWYKSNGLGSQTAIRGAYFLWCVSALFNFTGDLWPNLLSGLGEVRLAQKISLASLVAYYVVAITGLLLGVRLWALVVGNLLMGLIARQTGGLIVRERLAADGVASGGEFRADLLKTMWPNAWRIAAVSLGAFLIVQANTLICSAFLDLKTTASYGITFQVVMLISNLSTTWVAVKIPLINQLRAQHRNLEIADIFAKRVRLALGTYALASLGFILIGPAFVAFNHSKTHWIPLYPMILLLVTQMLEMHHSLYGGLVLTENYNPFLRPALISGVLIVTLSCILTPRIGLYGMICSTALVQACFNNWWPVWRGVEGLHIGQRRYWRYFFGLRSL
jgi:O-antigen/teichoic acid export membrane protein